MSRLDSVLRRLSAQRDGLNWAAKLIKGHSGDVLDLGLGNGRTYDHLREILPKRRIWVIDRALKCHPSCVPPAEDFLEGEADLMLARLAETGPCLALAHYDFGIGVDDKDRAEAARFSPLVAKTMLPGGIIVSSQVMVGFEQVTGPVSIATNRYMFYRA